MKYFINNPLLKNIYDKIAQKNKIGLIDINQ